MSWVPLLLLIGQLCILFGIRFPCLCDQATGSVATCSVCCIRVFRVYDVEWVNSSQVIIIRFFLLQLLADPQQEEEAFQEGSG